MGVLFTNNARSLLAAAVTATDTTVRVRVGHGDRYPLPKAADAWFPLTLEDESGNIEILRATARSGDSITVQRGAEGTQPRSFAAGDAVELRMTAAAYADLASGGGGSGTTVSVSISDASLG